MHACCQILLVSAVTFNALPGAMSLCVVAIYTVFLKSVCVHEVFGDHARLAILCCCRAKATCVRLFPLFQSIVVRCVVLCVHRFAVDGHHVLFCVHRFHSGHSRRRVLLRRAVLFVCDVLVVPDAKHCRCFAIRLVFQHALREAWTICLHGRVGSIVSSHQLCEPLVPRG